jgi:hypothetical protein
MPANFSQNLKVRSGNRIVPMFGGIPLGLIQSMRASDDYGPEPASGIGDIHVQEYVPGMARHTLSISTMVLYNSNMRQAGIAAENGDGALKGLVFDIVVQDKDTGQVLRTYVGCSYASGDVDVSKHTIVMMNGQFNALDVRGTGL